MMPRSGRSLNVYKSLTSRSNPFPATKRVTLVYEENQAIQLSLGAGNYVAKTYRCNGPFDPLADTGGHQPYGWDQWAAIYDQYCVDSSSISVEYCGQRTSSTIGPTDTALVAGICRTDGPTTWVDLESFQETRDSKSRLFGQQDGTIRLSHTYSSKLFAGKQKDALQAQVNGVPVEEMYWVVIVGQPSGSVNDNSSTAIKVRITYNITFTELKKLAKS